MSNSVVDWIKTIIRSVYPGAEEAGNSPPAGPRRKPFLGYVPRSTIAVTAIRGVVRVPRPDEVERYLCQHPGFQETVLRLCKAVREEFGPEAELSLEVYHDPEIDDHYLTLCVSLTTYPAGFMARIGRVVAPFEGELCENSGWIVVTSDFRQLGSRNAL